MITHTVIPAAGFGTRMLPAAKAVPKELLPVVDRPVLQYIVEEAADAGVRDVVLVTTPEKTAICEHFGPSARLRERLSAAGKTDLLASIDRLLARVNIHEVFQREQRGLGHAVLQARDAVGNHAFLCQLGDAVFSGDPDAPSPARQLIDAFERYGAAVIGLEQVPPEKVGRYGIVGGSDIGEGVIKLETLVEKPSPAAAPSRLAIAARYVLTPDIFERLSRTPVGAGGEIQLTDALKLMLDEGRPIVGVVLKARRHDIGNPADWLKTNLVFAWRDPALRAELAPLISALLGER